MTRICTFCNKRKRLSAFNKSKKGWKGHSAQCRKCQSKSKAGEFRYHNAFKLYKIRKNDYIDLLQKQEYKCAICSTLFQDNIRMKKQCVDHNHSTGVVRGLLCARCNLGLGYFNDNTQLMEMAIEYVRRGETQTALTEV